MTPLCRAYARLQYAEDKRFAWVLVEAITREMAGEDRKKKRPLWKDQLMWLRFAEMAVLCVQRAALDTETEGARARHSVLDTQARTIVAVVDVSSR